MVKLYKEVKMKKILFLFLLSMTIYGCTCKCKYNEYLPENNPLIIPQDLQPKA